MKKIYRALLPVCCALAIVPCAAGRRQRSCGLQSSVVRVNRGTVNPEPTGLTLPFGVSTGNAINGSFTYNPLQTGSGGVFSFKGQSAVQFFFTVTPDNFSDTYVATLTSNNAYTMTLTNSGKTLDVHVGLNAVNVTNPAILPVTAKTAPFVDLIFTGKNATTTLPVSQAAFTAEYTATAAKLTWDPPPISGQGGPTYGFTGTIDTINGQFVPEPSSLILMTVAVAVGGIGLAISRRKLARAS